MNQVKDPVCGMMVDPETAPAHTTYESQEVFFCSRECRREFEVDPARYAENLERPDARLMDTKSFVAPKLGSAGSGGLEYEPVSGAARSQVVLLPLGSQGVAGELRARDEEFLLGSDRGTRTTLLHD